MVREFIDPEKAEEVMPNANCDSFPRKSVRHTYRDIWYSTPYHKKWESLPSELLFRVWPPNSTLAMEQLALFFQALMGPPALLNEAATRFLNTLTWPMNPENEHLATIANAYSYILASNGNSAGTLTVTRTETGYPDAKDPVYVRFQKDVANTSVDVPRYPDGNRAEGREYTLDLGLLHSARRIQECSSNPPVEIELALRSYGIGGGDLGVGLEIREETTLDKSYRGPEQGVSPVAPLYRQ